MATIDIHRTLGALQQRGAALHLDTTDLCFLVALKIRADYGGLTSFDEDMLLEVFEQVCNLTDPGAASPRKRATSTLSRLREQRLLGRVDGAGLVRAGEYALTRLGAAIVEFFVADDALTRESLSVLTKALLSQLSEIKSQARAAQADHEWRAVVVALQVTVRDLVEGIERRQRSMDAQQQEVRERIAALLRAEWLESLQGCEALLDDTAHTLRELHDVLLQDTSLLHALLQEIESLADEGGADEASSAARSVMDQVDRVSAWGTSRQEAWSDYYQYVQRYLRSVVRLDPDRATSHRLQEQIQGWLDRPFYLTAVATDATTILREPDTRPVRPAVVRPRVPRERTVEVLPLEEPEVSLPALVARALAGGALRLSAVLEEVLPTLPAEQHFAATGRTAEVVAPRVLREGRRRPWVRVGEELEVEEWMLDGGAEVPVSAPKSRRPTLAQLRGMS